MSSRTPEKLMDHLFRHEAGKMIAVLSRVFGMQNMRTAEEVVQESFLKAAQTWPYQGIPDNPSAWLMQVARNKGLDILRREKVYRKSLAIIKTDSSDATEDLNHFFLDTEIEDSQLQLIFACCHSSLDEEDRIAFTLKTVSGFSSAEIARALLTNESNIQKRLYRARQMIRANNIELEIPSGPALKKRLDSVFSVLYLIFNEGYNSTSGNELIRKDLCAEAMRLCLLVNQHPFINRPEGFALLALMCFQASRMNSRLEEDQSIILLQHQDRSKWNRDLITMGYKWLEDSAAGDHLSVYHIESAIAAEYCLAATFENTNWMRLLRLYDLLLERKPTPVVRMNRAIILSQIGYTDNAISEILNIDGIEKLLATQYLYAAVLGELYLKSGKPAQAKTWLEKAYALTNSMSERKLIAGKLKQVQLQ